MKLEKPENIQIILNLRDVLVNYTPPEQIIAEDGLMEGACNDMVFWMTASSRNIIYAHWHRYSGVSGHYRKCYL